MDSTAAIVPLLLSGVGENINNLGKIVGTAAISVNGLVGDLLNVTLSSVSDVVTDMTPLSVSDDRLVAEHTDML